MRITNGMISSNFLNSLNKSLERQTSLQEQLADGKSIHRPSDDPVRVARSLYFNTNLTNNEQYTQNVKDAVSWMDTTDGILSDVSSVMIKTQELVTSVDGSKPTDALNAIGQEVDGLVDTIVQMGNSEIGDRYLFSGQMDKTLPLERKMITNTDTGETVEVVVYKGDNNKISMPLQNGLVDPNKDSVNLTAIEVFGPAEMINTINENGNPTMVTTLSVLNNLLQVKNELMKASPDVTWLTGTGLSLVQDGHNTVLKAQTELGARSSSYEMMSNILANSNTAIQEDLSANEDLDVSKAIIDFKTAENVYSTALSVGARIMPPSLVDFLK
ncbi:MAG: flagellar hook-associated protein 3 [Firmicutes bacterium]|nr:flagellar hook-associated protein 3 [Bacillota bacterium]